MSFWSHFYDTEVTTFYFFVAVGDTCLIPLTWAGFVKGKHVSLRRKDQYNTVSYLAGFIRSIQEVTSTSLTVLKKFFTILVSCKYNTTQTIKPAYCVVLVVQRPHTKVCRLD